MLRNLLFSFFTLKLSLSLFSAPLCAHVAKANGINIWYETFGKKKDPALLLIMGGLCQGILWPSEFCEMLAKKGFYVIRYDHRDSGFSSCFNFEKSPYTLLDMAKDAIGLLDALKIQKAHLCGLSMGGPIAELMSVHFSNRIETLTLIATSPDFRPSSLGYDGSYPQDITLSRPKDVYLQWMQKFLQSPPKTQAETLESRIECWSILNGSQVPFEKELNRKVHKQFLVRLKHPESLTNHLQAIKSSFSMIQEVPFQVTVPTLIFHGSEDPIFPIDHGEALHHAIKGSKYVFVQGMGHVLNKAFYSMIVQEMIKHTHR